MKKYLEEYCVGCGLCTALGKAECYYDEKGFMHPRNGDSAWLSQVCPSGGRQQALMEFDKIWGRCKNIYYGWSTDEEVRRHASSGGVITEVASWLVENGKVDGVIHTSTDNCDPTKTVSCISRSRGEIVSRSGSRYAISHPLELLTKIDTTKKYAFIGKPCDVAALNNYMEVSPDLKQVIVCTISFFCAGVPSKLAQNNLLEHLGCQKENLKALRYRGDGWPGYTTAVDEMGRPYKTDYATAWGKILGRDIMKVCRFCLDGIGETADIACGDAWYLTSDKKPDFSEADGRNVIFSRTERGQKILEEIVAARKIEVEKANLDDLKYIQTYQLERRATMFDKCAAMKISGRGFPKYRIANILQYSRYVSIKKHGATFVGIIKRVVMKKI